MDGLSNSTEKCYDQSTIDGSIYLVSTIYAPLSSCKTRCSDITNIFLLSSGFFNLSKRT